MILRPRYKKIKTTSKYRSGLEEQIATQLKLKNIKFEYETITLKYTKPEKVHRYTPDFILFKKDGEPMYIEGKGRFLTVDKQKSLLVKNQYPNLDLRFVFSNSWMIHPLSLGRCPWPSTRLPSCKHLLSLQCQPPGPHDHLAAIESKILSKSRNLGI